MSCAPHRQCEVERSLGLADLWVAGFVEWAAAAAPVLGREPGEFIRAYADNRAAAVRQASEDNPLAKAVRALAEEAERWEGAASVLLPLLDARVSEAARKHRSHPSTLAALGRALVRLT